MFTTLNDGTIENLVHIVKIYVDGSNVIDERARGSLDSVVEYFDTPEQALARKTELMNQLAI